MSLNWNASILAQPTNPANWLVAAVYDATAPLIVVDVITLPKPYGSTKNITFMNLDTVVYDFKLFESANVDDPTGSVLNSFSFQPSLGTITVVRDDDYLIAGLTAGFNVGGATYQDNSLIGWLFDIERVGVGTLQKGVDYELTLNGVPNNSTAANGWQLLVPGDQFGDQEKFFLHFQPQVTSSSTSSGSGGGGNIIAGVAFLDSDIALDNTYMKKACFLQGLTDHFTVTLPPLNTVGENQIITFISEGGNHINATIEVDGTDAIKYFGGNQGEMIVGQSEQFSLIKSTGFWWVLFPEGNFKTVGEVIHSYSMVEVNTVFANGVELSRTTYPRLWKHVQTLGGALVSDTLWNVTQSINGRTVYIHRGKFTTGDGSTTFRVPMIYATGNLKAVDGTTRLPGSFEADQVGQFDLSITGKVIKKGGNSNVIVALGVPSGPVSGANPDLTFGDYPINVGTINGTKENKDANIGIYALLRI